MFDENVLSDDEPVVHEARKARTPVGEEGESDEDGSSQSDSLIEEEQQTPKKSTPVERCISKDHCNTVISAIKSSFAKWKPRFSIMSIDADICHHLTWFISSINNALKRPQHELPDEFEDDCRSNLGLIFAITSGQWKRNIFFSNMLTLTLSITLTLHDKSKRDISFEVINMPTDQSMHPYAEHIPSNLYTFIKRTRLSYFNEITYDHKKS